MFVLIGHQPLCFCRMIRPRDLPDFFALAVPGVAPGPAGTTT
jgi:hypothetical protein